MLLNEAEMLPVAFIYERTTMKPTCGCREISEGLELHQDKTDAHDAASILPNPGLISPGAPSPPKVPETVPD